jgi:hypothetical protein
MCGVGGGDGEVLFKPKSWPTPRRLTWSSWASHVDGGR